MPPCFLHPLLPMPPCFLHPPASYAPLLPTPPASYAPLLPVSCAPGTYYEEGVSHDVIGHVALYEEVVHAMCSDGPIEGVVDGAVSHIRPIHTATQVEMDGVATQSECLTTLTHLNMLNPASEGQEVKPHPFACM